MREKRADEEGKEEEGVRGERQRDLKLGSTSYSSEGATTEIDI